MITTYDFRRERNWGALTMSSTAPLFQGRRLRLCYWSAEPRVLDSEVMGLEHHLARLGELEVVRLKALDAPEAQPCDLLIAAAQTIPVEGFPAWLRSLRTRIVAQDRIWTPALILADIPFVVLNEILPEAARENWYFDILAPGHVASLPIRVANLLRMHDHLHELKRYAAALDDINIKVKMLESQMRDLRAVTPERK